MAELNPSSGTGRQPEVRFESNRFLEPITGQWLQRIGDMPIADWVRSLPLTDVGLSTLNRWAEPIPINAMVAQTQQELRASMGLASDPLSMTGIVAQISREFDNIKVGYAMGSLASDIERRIAANPEVESQVAQQFADGLRQQARALSISASEYATPNPNVFAFQGQCYANANAMARAIVQYNNSVPQLSEYTPQMQQRDQLRALDQSVMENGHTPGLGYSWGATAYMYARTNTNDIDSLRRAYALGTLADAGLGLGAGSLGLRSSNIRVPGMLANVAPPSRVTPPYTDAATTTSIIPARPSWRASEARVSDIIGPGYRSQTSFRNGIEVRYGTPGSVRPEAYRAGSSVEVKNYNVETAAGRLNLVRNVSDQAIARATNLPPNTVQSVYIDVHGQNVTRADLNTMIESIVQRSNNVIAAGDIHILR